MQNGATAHQLPHRLLLILGSITWGSLISDGVQGMELYPWILIVPALTMTIFLFAMNFVGDGIRDAFDPQSKNRV